MLPPDLQARLSLAQPLLWHNPVCLPAATALSGQPYGLEDIDAARARWQRFAPLLARCFPDSVAADGRIDSPLLPQHGSSGPLWIKADHALPVTACIKARGGV